MAKKAKKVLSWVLLSLILLLLVALLGIGSYMTNVSVKRGSDSVTSISKTLTVAENNEQQAAEEKANAYKEVVTAAADVWAGEIGFEERLMLSKDALLLHAYSFEQKEYTPNWVILVHGYHSQALSNLYYAKEYFEHGYNVLLPDNRAHGKSEGKWIGMGYYEKRDLIDWISSISELYPDARFVLHGFSMGASTIMMACGEADFPKSVVACVEDAGYSSDWAELEDKLHKIYHLPTFPFLYAASIMTRVKAGYFISKADCVPALHKNRTPMLFIHGEADDFNPFYMLDVVYEANVNAQKQKLVVPAARHCMSSFTDPETYWSTVWSFLSQYAP